MSAPALSHKQASLLFRFTRLKFWEPENTPPPTVQEASAIIELCIMWTKDNDHATQDETKREIVRSVRKWFPDWTGDTLGNRPYGRQASEPTGPRPTQKAFDFGAGTKSATLPAAKASSKSEREAPAASEAPAPIPTPGSDKGKAPADAQEAPKATEAPKAEEKSEPRPQVDPSDTQAVILSRVNAGLRNLWLYGPAGTGKTTLCKLAAEALDLPCTILSCNAGTSPSEFLGHKFPEPRTSPVSRAIAQAGIIVFDEITTLDPSVAAVANALLANGELETTTGHVIRHEDCIIIATANTVGDGNDRQYIGNNQLDAATLDRFIGGMLPVDYSAEYESRFDTEVVEYVQNLRRFVIRQSLRRVVSTRAIIAAAKLKAAGIDWRGPLTVTWSETERQAAAAAGVIRK